jgi:hypothetical protein
MERVSEETRGRETSTPLMAWEPASRRWPRHATMRPKRGAVAGKGTLLVARRDASLPCDGLLLC